MTIFSREKAFHLTDRDAIAIMKTRQQKRLSELTESIFTKWKWQLNMNGGFLRWINGNRIDYTPSNIVFVSPQDANATSILGQSIGIWNSTTTRSRSFVPSWRENIHFWTEPAGP